jgi:hypothetical protein
MRSRDYRCTPREMLRPLSGAVYDSSVHLDVSSHEAYGTLSSRFYMSQSCGAHHEPSLGQAAHLLVPDVFRNAQLVRSLGHGHCIGGSVYILTFDLYFTGSGYIFGTVSSCSGDQFKREARDQKLSDGAMASGPCGCKPIRQTSSNWVLLLLGISQVKIIVTRNLGCQNNSNWVT